MCYITQVCTNFSFLCAISHRYDQFFIPMCYIKQIYTNFSFLCVISHRYALTFHSYVLYHIGMINSSFICVISHRYTVTFHSYVLYYIGMNEFFVPDFLSTIAIMRDECAIGGNYSAFLPRSCTVKMVAAQRDEL